MLRVRGVRGAFGFGNGVVIGWAGAVVECSRWLISPLLMEIGGPFESSTEHQERNSLPHVLRRNAVASKRVGVLIRYRHAALHTASSAGFDDMNNHQVISYILAIFQLHNANGSLHSYPSIPLFRSDRIRDIKE